MIMHRVSFLVMQIVKSTMSLERMQCLSLASYVSIECSYFRIFSKVWKISCV